MNFKDVNSQKTVKMFNNALLFAKMVKATKNNRSNSKTRKENKK